MLRAVIYARYSTDLQSAASVENQIASARSTPPVKAGPFSGTISTAASPARA